MSGTKIVPLAHWSMFAARASEKMTAQFQQNLLVASVTGASVVLALLAEEMPPVVALVIFRFAASLNVGLS